jgi:hypothetical protein
MAIFTGPERACSVFWSEETKSATQVERKFRIQYRKEPPSRPTIYSWHKNFVGDRMFCVASVVKLAIVVCALEKTTDSLALCKAVLRILFREL